ncbi:MAG TPA: Xaa-Pro peptidase family protein [Terriglobales bacterium]|nr:Xaa-Pro peptidase family protein [Terriglobales bacterium]
MPTRRRFLHASGAVALALPLRSAAASLSSAPADASLPAAIAKLTSRKDQARPIAVEERQARQEKARRLMEANDLDAIVLAEGTSLNYFTGIHWWGSERLFAMVLPAQGTAFYVCPAFEEGRAREQIAAAPEGRLAEVRTWQEDESPYQRVAQGLRDRSILTGKLGIEENVRFVFREGIANAAPQARLLSATPVTAGCRMIKSPAELDLMRLANQVTLTACEAVYHSLQDGMTQIEVGRLVDAAHSRLGFPGDALVEVGEFSAFPHGSTQAQVIRPGTPILIDGGCKVEGYQSDITRMLVLGPAPDRVKKVFDIVHRAQAVALAAAKPGAECGSVDAAARKVIADAGYGPDYKFFTHRVGHGIGMDGHEWPYLVRGNTTKLAPNMTFSDEPGIYIRGEFGARLEDDMHITEKGAELFTPQSPSLEAPFGKTT